MGCLELSKKDVGGGWLQIGGPRLQGPKLDAREALEEEKQVSPRPDEMRDKTRGLKFAKCSIFWGIRDLVPMKLMRLSSLQLTDRIIEGCCCELATEPPASLCLQSTRRWFAILPTENRCFLLHNSAQLQRHQAYAVAKVRMIVPKSLN